MLISTPTGSPQGAGRTKQGGFAVATAYGWADAAAAMPDDAILRRQAALRSIIGA